MQFTHLEFNGPIATVTLDHPAGNRINFQMREELLAAFAQVAKSNARALLIQGNGTDFCLGGDIRDWPGIKAAELRPRIEVFARAIDLRETLPIPTVAVVQGGCMGGGFELALGCDLIIAAASARFGFPEALLGIMTLQGGVYQLAECVGRNKAIELAFLSGVVEADKLEEWNVVNRVVDDADLDAEAGTLVQRLASGPPQSYAATKSLLRVWQQKGRSAARAALYDISMPLFDTADVQSALHEAVNAASAGLPMPKAIFPDQKGDTPKSLLF
jgi:enoyl-CoA hydratase/carnithine racemase